MKDFHSPTLDRTFESILFVPSIESAGSAGVSGSMSLAEAHQRSSGGIESSGVDLSGIEKPAGAMSIAEIFASRTELMGKEVLVLG
jgi:hypothetical protein